MNATKKEILIDAFIFLDTTRAELGQITPERGITYLRTEVGLDRHRALWTYYAWATTYDPDACAEDCVDNYLARSAAPN